MKQRAPMIDGIDVRNFKEELKNSVIKRSRVNYIAHPKEETASEEKVKEGDALSEELKDNSTAGSEAMATAEEILLRLQREAEADEKAKAAEWIAKYKEQEEAETMYKEMYNKTTGSYSGAYGKGDISEETKAQAANILGKRDADIADLFKQHSTEQDDET